MECREGDRMLVEEIGFIEVSSPVLFVVLGYEEAIILNAPQPFRVKYHYYIWLFGPKIKLPFESEWKEF